LVQGAQQHGQHDAEEDPADLRSRSRRRVGGRGGLRPVRAPPGSGGGHRSDSLPRCGGRRARGERAPSSFRSSGDGGVRGRGQAVPPGRAAGESSAAPVKKARSASKVSSKESSSAARSSAVGGASGSAG